MLDVFNIATAHFFDGALASQHRLRHRIFIERTEYDVPSFQGMEYDQYDTPAATYLTWRDGAGVVRGVARLSPTDRPYMLADHWPAMVSKIALPRSPLVLEGTRFGVDRDLPNELRRRIVAELVAGYLEFSLENAVEAVIGVMPTLIWRAVFSSNGWPVDLLGEHRQLGGDKCAAGLLTVSPEALARVRAKAGLSGRVIRTADDLFATRRAA